MYLWKSPDSVKNWNSVLEIFSCSVAGYISPGVSNLHLHTSSPIIFHGHPVPDVVGEHDMQLLDILEDLILYCMSNTILGQTGCSSAADVMMTRPSNVLERGETKTEA